MKSLYSTLIAIVAFVVFAPVSAMGDTWGEPINDPTRFVVLISFNNEAVLDNETRLVWEQSPDTGTRSWANAQAHCYQSNVGSRRGWRLPTVEELASLVDTTQFAPALPIDHPFTNVQSSDYWSATTLASSPGLAWFVNFTGGGVGFDDLTIFNFVWCVRGGQGVDPQ